MKTAFLALGSNLGKRQEFLSRSRMLLQEEKEIEVVNKSRLYETEPMGGPPGQSPFLNAVVEVRTELSSRQLLNRCLAIERFLGRERKTHWGPRTIDLDILFYGTDVFSGPVLTVPHPRLHERPFVLIPLGEIAPDWPHPLLKKTVAQLCAEHPDLSGVRTLKKQW